VNEFDEQTSRRLRRMVAGLPTHPIPEIPAVRSPRLGRLRHPAGAAVAVIVIVAALGVGLFVGARLPMGNGINANNGEFHGGGISFRYPEAWTVYPATAVGSFGLVFAVIGTADLHECRGPLGNVDVNCAYAHHLEPGTVRLVVGTGGGLLGTPRFVDRKPPGGWQLFVDGLPALVEESGPNAADASDLSVHWTIATGYTLSASLRGTGIEEMREELDALVMSIRFDDAPPPLPTAEAGAIAAAEAAATAIDTIDSSSREYGSDFYGCFPREPGASQTVVVTGGPGNPGSRLPGPVILTCSTEIAANELREWELTLKAIWPAGPGYPAGTYEQQLALHADGWFGVDVGTEIPAGSPLSATFPTAAPVAGPVSLELGRPAVVVDPGAATYLTPDPAGDSLSGMAVGTRIFVVTGPETIDGIDWYLVQWPPTRSYVPVLGWLPAKVDGRPQAETVEPDCPASPTLPELVAMAWGERLLCYGNDPITLSDVIVGDDEPAFEVRGEPRWLAEDSAVRLYDEDGPSGLGGSMPIHLDPASGLSLPTDTLLEVTGHFNDRAADGCTRAFVDEHASGLVPEDPNVQVLRCRENFVVTGFRAMP
jgi:hypothetical protein